MIAIHKIEFLSHQTSQFSSMPKNRNCGRSMYWLFAPLIVFISSLCSADEGLTYAGQLPPFAIQTLENANSSRRICETQDSEQACVDTNTSLNIFAGEIEKVAEIAEGKERLVYSYNELTGRCEKKDRSNRIIVGYNIGVLGECGYLIKTNCSNYVGANLAHHNLRGAVFRHCNFSSAIFTDSDLTGALFLDSKLQNIVGTSVKMDGVAFLRTTLSNSILVNVVATKSLFFGVHLLRSVLTGSQFDGAVFYNSALSNSSITDSSFAYSNLTKTTFYKSDLRNSNMMSVIQNKTNFDKALTEGVKW